MTENKKCHPRPSEVSDLTWPLVGRDLTGNHGGHMVWHVCMLLIIKSQEMRELWALSYVPDRYGRRNMTLRKKSQVTGHWGQGHKILRVDVKLINTKVLKVSSRSVAFYVRYSRKNLGLHQPPVPARVKPISRVKGGEARVRLVMRKLDIGPRNRLRPLFLRLEQPFGSFWPSPSFKPILRV